MPPSTGAVVTSATKLNVFLRQNTERQLVAAVVFAGTDVGYSGGAISHIGIAIGDSTTFNSGVSSGAFFVGEPELVACIDVSKMSPAVFKLSGLFLLLTSDRITKVMFDARLPSVALAAQHGFRPSPVFDVQIADVLFRVDTREKQLHRLRGCFHFRVFEAQALKTALANCVRLNSLAEALQEHSIAAPAVALDPPAADALALFTLYKRLEATHRTNRATAWAELRQWSSKYVDFHAEPCVREGEVDGQKARVARTGEGIRTPFYRNHMVLPLGVMPRRAAVGDGTQLQVGRIFTVDQRSKVCKGCRRSIGPTCDCFTNKSDMCYICEILNWSFRYRTEGKAQKTARTQDTPQGTEGTEGEAPEQPTSEEPETRRLRVEAK